MIKYLVTYLLIFIAGVSLVLGSITVFLKSPDEISAQYIALAHASLEQVTGSSASETPSEAAIQSLILAAKHQPYDSQIWQALSSAYLKTQKTHHAEDTQEIAQILGAFRQTAPEKLKQDMVSLSFQLSPVSTLLQ